MSYIGRFNKFFPVIILAAAVAFVLVSVLYIFPSSSPNRARFMYIFDGLFFITFVVAWHSIRSITHPPWKLANEPDPRLIYMTVLNDTDTDEYKRRLKMASDLFLQGTINTEEEFFWHVGNHTPREEQVFAALKEAKDKFRKNFRKFTRF